MLNTQLLTKNRSIAVSDTIVTRHLDVLALTETWQETSDDIQLKRCAPPGYSIVDAARSDAILPRSVAEKGGGVVITHSERFIVKKITLDVKPTAAFEVFCRSASITFVPLVIYRPGTKSATDGFFDELIALLEIVGTFQNELVITGELNIHVNDATDWHSRRLTDILESFNLVQAVSGPTRWQRNALDLVITRPDCQPTSCTVDPPKIISDHA